MARGGTADRAGRARGRREARHRRGHRLAGVVRCAVTGLLVSPFSWTHHWVWAVPLLIGLVTTARRRSRAWGLVAVVVAVLVSGFVPLARPCPPSPVLLLACDLYVLCLALLVGTALVLACESPVALPGRPDRAGIRSRCEEEEARRGSELGML